jgi:hypothetical protein
MVAKGPRQEGDRCSHDDDARGGLTWASKRPVFVRRRGMANTIRFTIPQMPGRKMTQGLRCFHYCLVSQCARRVRVAGSGWKLCNLQGRAGGFRLDAQTRGGKEALAHYRCPLSIRGRSEMGQR